MNVWDYAAMFCCVVAVGAILLIVPSIRQIRNSEVPWWAKQILRRLDDIVATLSEAVAGWRDYTADLKAQAKAALDARDAAVAALSDANDKAAAAAKALADFQADDAATDAKQLADQAQADADAVQAALDQVKAEDQTPVVDEPPVVSQPIDGIPISDPEPVSEPETPVSEPVADEPTSPSSDTPSDGTAQ